MKGHALQERLDRKELRLEFKNLPPSGKIKYISQSHKVEKVADEEARFKIPFVIEYSKCLQFGLLFCLLYQGNSMWRQILFCMF
ncbi:hypothetical protein CICLE_v10029708mg [Citrus x clementina]|uniref:Uncharacterized protein n=1 Tax=Citrus clementina TaxID=85681 RepID=V4SDN0_CITCL|nr:hypothetical protein CICLE_v10029708mg [Citrus x clementina]